MDKKNLDERPEEKSSERGRKEGKIDP